MDFGEWPELKKSILSSLKTTDNNKQNAQRYIQNTFRFNIDVAFLAFFSKNLDAKKK